MHDFLRAVGFKNIEGIAEYTNRTVDTLEYDYILLDIDNAESAMNFGIDKAVQNFFVTSFDTYDIFVKARCFC